MQTAIVLGIAQLLVKFVPFRRLSTYLGNLNKESDFHLSRKQLREVRRVQWSLNRVSTLLPWQSACLMKAITAKFLLSQRRTDTTLYLGAVLNPEKGLDAHAWLRCGSVFVTGGASHDSYRVLASFS